MATSGDFRVFPRRRQPIFPSPDEKAFCSGRRAVFSTNSSGDVPSEMEDDEIDGASMHVASITAARDFTGIHVA